MHVTSVVMIMEKNVKRNVTPDVSLSVSQPLYPKHYDGPLNTNATLIEGL